MAMLALISDSARWNARLYGSFGAIHNPGKHQHVDLCDLGAEQRTRAGIERRACGENVVDQHQAATSDLAPQVTGYLECALHIACPLRPGKPDLLLGRPHA